MTETIKPVRIEITHTDLAYDTRDNTLRFETHRWWKTRRQKKWKLVPMTEVPVTKSD